VLHTPAWYPEQHNPDCWDVIGGHADEGEEPIDTLRREIKEEIGVKIEEATFMVKLIDEWGEETYLYRVELNDDQADRVMLGNEGLEKRFFDVAELTDLKLTANMKRYVREGIV